MTRLLLMKPSPFRLVTERFLLFNSKMAVIPKLLHFIADGCDISNKVITTITNPEILSISVNRCKAITKQILLLLKSPKLRSICMTGIDYSRPNISITDLLLIFSESCHILEQFQMQLEPQLNDVGMGYLLGMCDQIHTIVIDGSANVGDETVNLMCHLQKLKHLSVSQCPRISSEAFCRLILYRNHQLTTLNVSANRWVDSHVISRIVECPLLETIDISLCAGLRGSDVLQLRDKKGCFFSRIGMQGLSQVSNDTIAEVTSRFPKAMVSVACSK